MHWWDTAVSSPSSSADDNYINNRTNGGRMSNAVSLFSTSRPVGSHHRRGVTSSRTDQHLTDDDVVVQTPSRSISTPQTLPLPEYRVLLKRGFRCKSATNQTSKYVLPSPEDAIKKSVKKTGVSDANHSDLKGPPRITTVDRSRDTEHKESKFLQNSPQRFNFTARSRDGHKHGTTVSAPTTPISSHTVYLLTSKTDMSAIQLWSPPELSSPLHGPQIRTSTKNPKPSSSPLHKKSPIESPMSRHGSNAQVSAASVHPLPLPPGAPVHPPSSPANTNNKPHSVTPRQSQWQKGKLIGRGTFGTVYVGSNRETGALCAMKEVEILPDDPKSVESIKQLEQEINVLSQLKHPNIVQYYGSEIVGNRLYIYLEYVHPGSINKYARDHFGGMTESIVRSFTRHIVSGLAYLHSTKTIHRDIKGANLLVDANGVVKLADFGMAKHLSGQVHLSLKGSPYWMAPELLQGDTQKDSNPDLALAVDIWSLGCTIIEMMNGKPPWSEFEGPAAMFKVMKETPPIPESMSPEGKSFLHCCFIRNPAERPTATMLLEHRFLNNSSQLDIPASTNSPNRMTLTVQNRRERSRHRPD
ncbi:unnamed protein product [Lactuca virosa]|uniref:mitogen-activated protein kinase kinase kinase n=1 Tax=Lactuca virosa TaxID=75947 RepID=A0AAU9LIY8_9ASTR|nr:unnamed protein product [Lactuca virosa]